MKINDPYSASHITSTTELDLYPTESWQEILGGTVIALSTLVLLWATL